MKGLIPAPKGRVRTPVGHKYLEALQSKVNGYSDASSSPSPSAEQKQPGLDLLILGITSGTSMDEIDFALCRFTQESPEAPLCLDIVQVRSLDLHSEAINVNYSYSMIRSLCPRKSEPTSSPCCEKTMPHQVCSLRWMRKWVTPSQMRSISSHTSTQLQ